MKKIDINLLRGLGYDSIQVSHHYYKQVETCPDQSDELISEIFAPSKDTGFPESVLSLNLSAEQRRELDDYLKGKLLKPIPSPVAAPDDDTAFESMRFSSEQFGMENDSYYQRLHDMFIKPAESED